MPRFVAGHEAVADVVDQPGHLKFLVVRVALGQHGGDLEAVVEKVHRVTGTVRGVPDVRAADQQSHERVHGR
ncbi:hypothetical protein [Streptomyces sp. NPDC093060]|uniref:hypothetical protein n=1 Tax=Streptomyces sp. NPDC093060 TaxID=3366019 RepID=UPI003806CA58